MAENEPDETTQQSFLRQRGIIETDVPGSAGETDTARLPKDGEGVAGRVCLICIRALIPPGHESGALITAVICQMKTTARFFPVAAPCVVVRRRGAVVFYSPDECSEGTCGRYGRGVWRGRCEHV